VATREHHVQVVLNDHEAAILDERRGTTPRGTYLRQQLHGPPTSLDMASRSEALALLTELARDRRTQAVIALERALREVDHEEEWLFDAE
jgi:hypothetical protein